MLTRSVTYINHNEEEVTDVLNFHISQADFTEHFELQDRLQELMNMLEAPTHTYSATEVQQMMDIVRYFLRLSYGVRLANGSFDKDDPIGSGPVFHAFRIAGSYDVFLKELFNPPTNLLEFVADVLPAAMLAEISESDPRVAEELAKIRSGRVDTPERLAPGTRIVDDVPVAPPTRLASVPDEAPDYDKMLAEAEAAAEQPKKPIRQSQHDLMEKSLSPKQFTEFMSTRVVDPTLG